jgi:hypothetical protein
MYVGLIRMVCMRLCDMHIDVIVGGLMCIIILFCLERMEKLE